MHHQAPQFRQVRGQKGERVQQFRAGRDAKVDAVHRHIQEMRAGTTRQKRHQRNGWRQVQVGFPERVEGRLLAGDEKLDPPYALGVTVVADRDGQAAGAREPGAQPLNQDARVKVHHGVWAAGGGATGRRMAPGGDVVLAAPEPDVVRERIEAGVGHLRISPAVKGRVEPVRGTPPFQPAAAEEVMERLDPGAAHVGVGQEVVGPVEVGCDQVAVNPFPFSQVKLGKGVNAGGLPERLQRISAVAALQGGTTGRGRDAAPMTLTRCCVRTCRGSALPILWRRRRAPSSFLHKLLRTPRTTGSDPATLPTRTASSSRGMSSQFVKGSCPCGPAPCGGAAVAGPAPCRLRSGARQQGPG